MSAAIDAVRSPTFEVPESLVATGPPERAGARRDAVAMLVASRGGDRLDRSTVAALPRWLRPTDVLVLNVSQTLPAAVPVAGGGRRMLHLASPQPDGTWIVEPRLRAGPGTAPLPLHTPVTWVLAGGGRARLVRRFPDEMSEPRLWVAELDLPESMELYLDRHGEPIRYGYVAAPWPLDAYRTIYGTRPGSAEMPSAGRPLTRRLMHGLTRRGVDLVPVVLHCGVSSSQIPVPERFEVPASTARRIVAARTHGGRVIAVGTSVVRALASATDGTGAVRPAAGWTDLRIGPRDEIPAVDGLLTGWHEPDASHLDLLTAVAGREVVERSYRAALETGMRWHEFGDVLLVVP